MLGYKIYLTFLEKVFITKTFIQCKTSCTFKIDVFEIQENKNIWKLLSKYELIFLDKVNSSSDPSEILILQSPISRAFLPPSLFLYKFDIAN